MKMAKLIDANKIKYRTISHGGWGMPEEVADKFDIDKIPTVDAVPVVRCEECLHYVPPDDGDFLGLCTSGILAVSNNGQIYPVRAFFCPYGERKDNG